MGSEMCIRDRNDIFQMNNKLKTKINKVLTLFFLLIFLNQCGMGADARKYPPEPEKRVAKNIEEGRGFRLMGGDKKKGWRF